MYAVEFQGNVSDGMIEIPERYRDQVGKHVRVIVLVDQKEEAPPRNMIDHLLKHPLHVRDFNPLTREEVHER